MTDNFARLLALMSSGGTGGVRSYNDLTDKPSVGGVTLIGEMTLADLGIVVDDHLDANSTNPVQNAIIVAALNNLSYNSLLNKPSINNVTLAGNTTLAELGLRAIWVGTRAEYEIAVQGGEIDEGTIVIITDDDVDQKRIITTTRVSQAITATVTQQQIDANDGYIPFSLSIFPMTLQIPGSHTLNEDILIEVSGLTKETPYSGYTGQYTSFVPEWYLQELRQVTISGAAYTEIIIGVSQEFCEPDEVRTLPNGGTLTRSGGDSYAKDANGNITVTIPAQFWRYDLVCHFN